jgi:hypothetical protein
MSIIEHQKEGKKKSYLIETVLLRTFPSQAPLVLKSTHSYQAVNYTRYILLFSFSLPLERSINTK